MFHNQNLLVSVIIPSYNCQDFLPLCLNAIKKSDYPNYEIILVDDRSTDNTVEIARKAGVTVIEMKKNSGPGAARNVGARHAKGDIYLFVDSDVVIKPDSISIIVSAFLENPQIGALFGSYDNQPQAKNFCSQYKNLFHHFIHQTSHRQANTFWAGCGAVRKDVFWEVGGFDDNQYKVPSIEDIELGLRIDKHGYRIMLVKELQAKHLKKWGLWSLLYTDIFCRAIPWSNLIHSTKEMPKGLNFQKKHLVSSLCVALFIALAIFFLLEYKLFSFIPDTAFYYYLKLSAILVFLCANFFIFYRRMFQLLEKGRHLKYLLPMLFFIVSGIGLVFGFLLLIDAKLFSFIPDTRQYYHLKVAILIVFFLVNFVIFYFKLPTVKTRSVQWNMMIRIFFICATGIVIFVLLHIIRKEYLVKTVASTLVVSYFTFVLIAVNIFLLNSRLYRFFFNLRGLKFLFLAIVLHVFYYLYSGLTFVVCWPILYLRKILH